MTSTPHSRPIVRPSAEAALATLVFTLLVALGAGSRLVPHAPNFTALAAVTLFAGFYFRRSAIALAVPMVAMLLSDLVLGGYPLPMMATVYASIALGLVLRRVLGDGRSPARLGAAAVASSLSFFLITNFGVWAFESAYPSTGTGLLACYAAGLPFLKYQLAGDLCYTGAIFGGYAVLTHTPRALLPEAS